MATIVPVAGKEDAENGQYGKGISKQRTQDFKLTKHSHGKSRVRVLKVRRGSTHEISEWTVHTILHR